MCLLCFPALEIMLLYALPGELCFLTPFLRWQRERLVERLCRFHHVSRRDGESGLLQLLEGSTGARKN